MGGPGEVHQSVSDPGGKAEVDQPGHAKIVIHHDIGRPDIALDDTLFRVRQNQQLRPHASCDGLQTGRRATLRLREWLIGGQHEQRRPNPFGLPRNLGSMGMPRARAADPANCGTV